MHWSEVITTGEIQPQTPATAEITSLLKSVLDIRYVHPEPSNEASWRMTISGSSMYTSTVFEEHPSITYADDVDQFQVCSKVYWPLG